MKRQLCYASYCRSRGSNVKIMEMDIDAAPRKDDIVTDIPDIKDGYIYIPRKPGPGGELNEKEIVKHPWHGHRG